MSNSNSQMTGTDSILNLNNDMFYKWQTLPFVAANIMWDYIDSFRSIAIQLRPQGTKQYSREIKELYNEYNKQHKKQISKEALKQEEELTEILTDDLTELMNIIQSRVNELLKKRNKKYSLDDKWMAGSAFGATVFSKSVMMYEDDLRSKTEKKLNKNFKSNLPNSFKKAGNVIENITNVLFPEYKDILTEYKYMSLKYLKEFEPLNYLKDFHYEKR